MKTIVIDHQHTVSTHGETITFQQNVPQPVSDDVAAYVLENIPGASEVTTTTSKGAGAKDQ